MSLRVRLAIILAVISFLTVSVVGAAAYASAAAELSSSRTDFLQDRTALVVSSVGAGQLNSRGPGQARLDFEQLDSLVQVIYGNGEVEVLGDIAIPVSAAASKIADDKRGQNLSTVSIGGADYDVLTTGLARIGAVQIAVDTTNDDLVLRGLGRRLFALGLLASAVAAFVGWLVATRVTGPIGRLRAAAAEVTKTGALDGQVPVEGDAEVGGLARDFNAMLAALHASKDQQRRLVDDAGHDLRTPLTSLRTNVDLLVSTRDIGPVDRAALHRDLQSEVGELQALVNGLIDVTRDDEATVVLETVQLDELVEHAATRAARRLGRSVVAHTTPETVHGDRVALARAVDNLIGNAGKFSPADTPIVIEQGGGRIAVIDRGPGVAPAERARIFDRFYRSDATRSSPGSGLGLAIVAQVAERHGGQTFAEDNPEGGAIIGFSVRTTPGR